MPTVDEIKRPGVVPAERRFRRWLAGNASIQQNASITNIKDACMPASKKVTGRAKGGVAAAAKMSKQDLAARAKKGAVARWGLKATHKGNFKDEFGFDVECFVLDDDAKTAVISQRGMGEALGMSEGGSRLPVFLKGQRIAPYVGHELAEKLEKPIVFQGLTVGTAPPPTGHGYDVTILIDVCKAILAAEADGALQPRQQRFATQAHVILGASAKAGIKGLVYALAGYRPEVEEVIKAFKAFVQEEAKKYEAEFPNELYEAWLRLYSIPKPTRGKPWKAMHLTRRHIYFPLAQSNGKVYELLKALKAKGGDQKTKLFQFLNDIGARALRMQIGRVLEMAQSSKNPYEYEARIIERFGGQQELELVLPLEEAANA